MTFHPVENVSLLYLTSSTSQITCPAFEELHNIISTIRGGIKKLVFFTFLRIFLLFTKRGRGVSANPKNPYQKKVRFV